MKIRRLPLSFWAAAILVAVNPGAAQDQRGPGLPRTEVKCFPSLLGRNFDRSQKGIVGEIEDAGLGARWLSFRNESHPEEPGRLVLQRSQDGFDESIGCRSDSHRESQTGGGRSRKLAIHAGDQLVVKEHRSLVDVQLLGVALGSAVAGDALNVRLSLGGKTVRAIAVQAGLATLSATREVQP